MVDLQGCIISKETFFEYQMKQIFWILPEGLTASLLIQPYLGIIWLFYCIDYNKKQETERHSSQGCETE